MRTGIGLTLYEIKYKIFPTQHYVSAGEYLLIKKAVMKHKKEYPLPLLESYLEKWIDFII